MACGQSPAMDASFPGDKARKMTSVSGFGPLAQESIDFSLEMLRDFRYDEACVFLHGLNQHHIEEWSYVKDELIKRVDQSKLAALSTILECSTKADLSACNPLIPGLSRHIRPSEWQSTQA